MDRIKTKFIIAITGRLSAAPDSDAKTELIEELSDNLCGRYQDFLADGMGEEEAYRRAMDDLGDVNELIAYLRSVESENAAPGCSGISLVDDILRSTEDILRETISQAKDAADQAKVIARDVTRKIREKYPDGFESNVRFHYDDAGDCHAGMDNAQGAGEGAAPESAAHRDVLYGFGYDKKKGGFYTQWGEYKGKSVESTAVASANVRGIDVAMCNGDVIIETVDDPNADIVVEGETEKLELLLSEGDGGVLSVRQKKTAATSFLFGRGMASVRFKLYLPRKSWEFVQISSTAGDVEITEELLAQRLAVRTTSGDIAVSRAVCDEIIFKSASGDIDGADLVGYIKAETMSGDIDLSGDFTTLQLSSMSGDIEVDGSVAEICATSVSGDVEVRSHRLPTVMELNSKSGDCEACIPRGEGFTVEYQVVSGDFNTDFPLTGTIGAKSGRAVYLNGGEETARVYQMSSVSGDVSVEIN